MSRAENSSPFNVDLAVNHLLNFPETIPKYMYTCRSGHETKENQAGVSSIPVDILDSPKDYTFYLDVPGLSKSDIQVSYFAWLRAYIVLYYLRNENLNILCMMQVTVEDDSTLVIRSNGKRKREDGEQEGCKYVRLERRAPQKLLRKFRLPENANVGAITAKCVNGVLTLVVDKLPPPPKPKTVVVNIS